MKKSEFLDILHSEIEASTGCTDPGSISLAVANAVTALGKKPQEIFVHMSPNVYKNAVSVGIPGTYKSGIELAAALGALINEPEKGLAILSGTTDELIAQAEKEVEKGHIKVTYGETPDPLYVKAKVCSDGDTAEAIISGDYSRVVEITKNGRYLKKTDAPAGKEELYPLIQCTVKELYDLILEMDASDFDFLIDYARKNMDAVQKDIDNPKMCMGRLMRERLPHKHHDLFDVVNYAQTNTAAAGEARMKGINVTIMAIAGSGNHGITNFLGILSVAEALGCTQKETAKALAISSMITIYIKGYVKRMTAFCGCGVAAATGVAAGTVYLLGGDFEKSVDAMQSVIGTIGGMFCDGAKESCSYKLSIATSTAIQFAYLAMNGCHIPKRVGIIGPTIEKTFENMGRLNNPGMVETDKVLVSIVQANKK